MFEIEKGVPIPSWSNPNGGRNAIYPFREMEVGDSFFVPGKNTRVFSSVARHWRKSTGFKYSFRTVEGGVRVWRVA